MVVTVMCNVQLHQESKMQDPSSLTSQDSQEFLESLQKLLTKKILLDGYAYFYFLQVDFLNSVIVDLQVQLTFVIK